MDADLSTDLRALPPLLAPLLSGHSDVAIGTRLAPGSRVVRGAKRELISRGYNRLLHTALGARFSDAQCGFKAVRTDAARRLLPCVRDEGWFFDTELLVLAQREGMRIHEVPVDWVDDPDSRVDLLRTALEDLRGIARLLSEARLIRFLLRRRRLDRRVRAAVPAAARRARGRGRQRARARGHRRREHAGQPAPDLRHLRAARPDPPARDGRVRLRAHPRADDRRAGGAARARPRSRAESLELAVLVAAGVGATVTRYMALRSWVFARRGERASLQPVV